MTFYNHGNKAVFDGFQSV